MQKNIIINRPRILPVPGLQEIDNFHLTWRPIGFIECTQDSLGL